MDPLGNAQTFTPFWSNDKEEKMGKPHAQKELDAAGFGKQTIKWGAFYVAAETQGVDSMIFLSTSWS
jgi:hypothetical protein